MSEGPSRDGVGPPTQAQAVPPAPEAVPAKAPSAGGKAEPESLPPEKAYVAPREIKHQSVPSNDPPDAKVVLNLPEKPAGTVGEAEVRAARARRRAATVKIDRSAVDETLKVAELGMLGVDAASGDVDVDIDVGASPPPAVPVLAAPVAPEAVPPLVAPAVPARRQVVAPVLTPVRAFEPPAASLDDERPASSGAKSLALAVAALVAVSAAGYFALRGDTPQAEGPTSPPKTPAAPTQIVDVTPPSPTSAPQTATAAAQASASAPPPSTTVASSPAAPPPSPRTVAPPRPPRPTPAPPAAAPAPKPVKPKPPDIPSEI